MKLTKSQGVSFFAAIVAFAVLSIALFLLPIRKSIVFWSGYVFMVYSLVLMLVSLLKFFRNQSEEGRFLKSPIVVVSWLYLIAQIYLTYKEVTTLFLPYRLALIINLSAGLFFTILMMALSASSKRIEQNDNVVIEKRHYIDLLKFELQAIVSNDTDLKRKIDNLIDDVTYSDPMSHSDLSDIEDTIIFKIKELSEIASDPDLASIKCDEISRLLKRRNEQCLILKKVKEIPPKNHDNSGTITAISGVGVALIFILGVMGVVFYVVPEMQYKDACELMDTKHYDRSLFLFEGIENYKDSSDRIQEIYTIMLQIKYDAASQLADSHQYEEAIVAFQEIIDFSDSSKRISDLETLIIERDYQLAENAFDAGDYDKALSLYVKVSPYMNSRDRIVDINNRLSSGAIIYLGTYKGEPIAWRILKMDGYKRMLLMTDKPIRNLPISDDIADTSFEDSELAHWINTEFIADFTEKEMGKILDSEPLKVFLLSKEEIQSLKASGKDFSSDSEWWIRSEGGKGFKYVTTDGVVKDGGDIHLRDKGVRPAIWMNLQ